MVWKFLSGHMLTCRQSEAATHISLLKELLSVGAQMAITCNRYVVVSPAAQSEMLPPFAGSNAAVWFAPQMLLPSRANVFHPVAVFASEQHGVDQVLTQSTDNASRYRVSFDRNIVFARKWGDLWPPRFFATRARQ
jgi:hypothetical protein